MNQLQMSCVIIWAWSFLTSKFVEAVRGQKHHISGHTLALSINVQFVSQCQLCLPKVQLYLEFQSQAPRFSQSKQKETAALKFISLCPMQNEGLFNESWAAANALLNLHIVVTIYTSFSGDPHAYRRIFQPAHIVHNYVGTCERYANA